VEPVGGRGLGVTSQEHACNLQWLAPCLECVKMVE
jgi:hypothetical protein